jgi:hypothetical protein
MFVLIKNNKPTVIGHSFTDSTGVQHSRSVLSVWPLEDLRQIGVLPVIDDPPEIQPHQKRSQIPMEQWAVFADRVEAVYTVEDMTTEEFNALAAKEDENISALAVKKLLMKQIESTVIPEDELDDFASLFPVFRAGESVAVADRRQYDGVVWEVIQAHTTQADWLPPNVPALWKRVHSPETIPVWYQPTGSHDAWPVGARVQWPDGGQVWESTIPANTTVPGENLAHGYWVAV